MKAPGQLKLWGAHVPRSKFASFPSQAVPPPTRPAHSCHGALMLVETHLWQYHTISIYQHSLHRLHRLYAFDDHRLRIDISARSTQSWHEIFSTGHIGRMVGWDDVRCIRYMPLYDTIWYYMILYVQYWKRFVRYFRWWPANVFALVSSKFLGCESILIEQYIGEWCCFLCFCTPENEDVTKSSIIEIRTYNNTHTRTYIYIIYINTFVTWVLFATLQPIIYRKLDEFDTGAEDQSLNWPTKGCDRFSTVILQSVCALLIAIRRNHNRLPNLLLHVTTMWECLKNGAQYAVLYLPLVKLMAPIMDEHSIVGYAWIPIPLFSDLWGTPASMAPRLEVFPPCFDAHDFVWDPALLSGGFRTCDVYWLDIVLLVGLAECGRYDGGKSQGCQLFGWLKRLKTLVNQFPFHASRGWRVPNNKAEARLWNDLMDSYGGFCYLHSCSANVLVVSSGMIPIFSQVFLYYLLLILFYTISYLYHMIYIFFIYMIHFRVD